MRPESALLPWSGAPVRKIGNLHAYLSEHLPEGASRYLPASISLFLDPEIPDSAADSFLREMAHYLGCELLTRLPRRDVFVKLGLLSQAEIEAFLTARTDIQPWVLYYSKDGGLGTLAQNVAEPIGRQCGVIPCSSMRNHGVAWHRTREGRLLVWLATARKEGRDWDWDSDIGHESAHAAFAPVPLFIQSRTLDNVSLSAVERVQELTSEQLARILYFYSEIAVVAVRGERRPTPTGLPVAEYDELNAFLELSDKLIPKAGFRQALAAFAHVNGSIDMHHGTEIYEIAAPIIRIIPYLTRFTKAGTAPTLSAFRAMIGSKLNVSLYS